MLELKSVLKDSIQEIIDTPNSNTFEVKTSLRNYDDSSFVIDDLILNTIVMSSNFSTAVADDIQASITVNFKELLQIGKHLTSSYISIVLEYLDNTGAIDLNKDPEVLEYRVFFHDFENIAKRYNINNIENLDPNSPSAVEYGERFTAIDLRVQFVDDKVYNLTKRSIQVISSRTSISTLIRYIASRIGVVKTKITPADNTITYNRINIPVEETRFDRIFDYLQDRYGIYNSGLAFYYGNDGTFYMYPKFDVNPDREDILRIFKVNPGMYAGLENRWKQTGEIIEIICDSEIRHIPVAHKLLENKGSAKIFASSDKIIDGQVTVNPDRSVKMNNIHYAVTSNVNQTLSDQGVIPDFKGETMNQYQLSSELAESNTELLVIVWEFSKLFSVRPGMRVEYVYDERDKTMVLTGVVESIVTEVLRGTRQFGKFKYSASSVVTLRLTTEAVLYRTAS